MRYHVVYLITRGVNTWGITSRDKYCARFHMRYHVVYLITLGVHVGYHVINIARGFI